ncbi:MAG TPA: hypothetical protein DCY48_03625 [Candidatus Magasanikbacteria bacterium]|nr:MAG: hypothetical protein A3I74_04650 [Candidatus Magasanikbacteria bacterium RIFCSPLOWO2_02_FULL_47_16]OGH79495.1 MAG: hypothetical protein A3C10_01620 [Candidatus Magasanikbacteria bacterium RIFCSPHIGHO2_02_FULL_48_18]OGH83159.1 MAG: hypothetical protein A3G08_04540 [Candidatus Magasanikbacteria bacterium RIFCSPLOWO2_12_FULL_47_9b]HAZ28834.1 hypothetical protein [Candidatus Magasanikbacteria bacterium]
MKRVFLSFLTFVFVVGTMVGIANPAQAGGSTMTIGHVALDAKTVRPGDPDVLVSAFQLTASLNSNLQQIAVTCEGWNNFTEATLYMNSLLLDRQTSWQKLTDNTERIFFAVDKQFTEGRTANFRVFANVAQSASGQTRCGIAKENDIKVTVIPGGYWGSILGDVNLEKTGASITISSATSATPSQSVLPESGWNPVPVEYCRNIPGGIKVTKFGQVYNLLDGVKDVDSYNLGMKKYTYACVSSTMYNVKWEPPTTGDNSQSNDTTNTNDAEDTIFEDEESPELPGSDELPDLVVESVSLEKGAVSYTSGGTKYQRFKVSFSVKNKGEADADGRIYFTVKNEKGKGSRRLLTRSGLDAGKSLAGSFYFRTSLAQAYSIAVDPADLMEEHNESNNAAGFSVSLDAAPVETQTLGTPTITKPSQNTVLTNYPRRAELAWTSVSNIDYYDIEIYWGLKWGLKENGTYSWYGKPIVYVSSYPSFVAGPLTGDNDYKVHVRAVGKDGSKGPWSDYVYFSYDTSDEEPLVVDDESDANTLTEISVQSLLARNPSKIDFEDMTFGADLTKKYWDAKGVGFSSQKGKAIYITPYNRSYEATASGEYSIANDATYPNTSANDPLIITFQKPVQAAGMYLGNGTAYGVKVTATVTAYDNSGAVVGRVTKTNITDAVTTFVGFSSTKGVSRVAVDYGDVLLSEEIDDLLWVAQAS